MKKLINRVSLEDLYDFIESGNPNDAPADLVAYIELLTRVDGMIRRIDKFGSKRAVIKHLMAFEKMTYYESNKTYNEAIEYFFSDVEVSKEAWRNFYANIIDEEINFSRQIKRDTQDSKRIADMVKTAMDARKVNEDDKEDLSKELFMKQFIVYETDAEKLGMPKVDRNRLKKLIDEKIPELTEKERHRLYQEADIIPFEAFPDEQKDPRKN